MDTTHEPVQHAEAPKLAGPCRAAGDGGVPPQEQQPLPVAQRNDELSDRDFEVLRRVAEDPQAPAGRLRRQPKKVPVCERTAARE